MICYLVLIAIVLLIERGRLHVGIQVGSGGDGDDKASEYDAPGRPLSAEKHEGSHES